MVDNSSRGARLKALLQPGTCVVTPGCHDALSARIAQDAGFEAISVSGFGVEAALLGQPDIGLLTLSELLDQARRIAASVSVPVTCDGETGFGGVHNVARMVREMEACGLAGVQIEDQSNPKRCPMLEGRTLVDTAVQVERLRAALEARQDPDFLLIARCDADVVSIAELVERCNRYLAAGADMAMPLCFEVDGRSMGELDADAQMEVLAKVAAGIEGPVKGVMIPAGYTANDMGEIGYQMVGLTGGPIEAAVNAMHAAYSSIRETGSESAYRAANPPRFPAPRGVMELLGVETHLDFERRMSGDGD